MSRIITIIPARGGSKGIPGKNIIDFCGKPLLAWSIIQALNSKFVNQVYVSSDSDDILTVAGNNGAIPIKRPDNISTDTASSESALLHALDFADNAESIPSDIIVFLQPTSPLRTSTDIDAAIKTFVDGGYDSLFSASNAEDMCLWTKTDNQPTPLNYDPVNRGRRQEREPMYLENGSIYVFSPKLLREGGNRLGGKIGIYLMEPWKSFEVDSYDDLELCRYYFRNKILNQPHFGT